MRRAHGGRGNSKDLLDSLTSKAEFGDDLFIGERGEESVGPGVDANLVTGDVLLDQNIWSLYDAGADNKEGGCDVLIIKVFEQFAV